MLQVLHCNYTENDLVFVCKCLCTIVAITFNRCTQVNQPFNRQMVPVTLEYSFSGYLQLRWLYTATDLAYTQLCRKHGTPPTYSNCSRKKSWSKERYQMSDYGPVAITLSFDEKYDIVSCCVWIINMSHTS